MNTSRVEELLEQLVNSQDTLNYRLERIESLMQEQLSAANHALLQIQGSTAESAEELSALKNWEVPQAMAHLQAIEDELAWHKDLSFGKQMLTALEGIETQLSNIDTQLTINGS